jgi:serine/threonine-protein kinase
VDTQRWATLSALLDELLELDPPNRARRLAQIADEDAALGSELHRMMALEEERPDFLGQSMVDAAVFAPQPGQLIGPYRLERQLGEGGMGQVWLALRADGLYQRRVALKLLRPGLGDAGLRSRFTRERQILARLGHAHIARLLDAGISSDGQPYLALDYVQGVPITQYVQEQRLTVRARLVLYLQVCAAVSHAHANLVVHRDLKPSNILVTAAGEVCLLDFGIAKLLDEPGSAKTAITVTGARAFTLHYAAPEQLGQGAITTMTDVYSLGVVLYEVLTGRKPYEPARSSDAAWEEAILQGDPVRPSHAAFRQAREEGVARPRRVAAELAGDLDNVLLKAMAKAPEHRYVSAEALAQDLRHFLDGEPVQARAQSWGYRARKFVGRNALALGMAGALTALLVVALVFMALQARMALREAQRAQAMQDFTVALFENTEQPAGNQGLDVRTLLEAGVRRADTELLGQPQARAELLGLVVRLRQGLGDDRQALDLLDRQSQVLATIEDQAPAHIGIDSAAMRGRSLRALGQPEVCVRSLAPWLPASQEQAVNYPREVAEFLSQLGRCHRQMGDREAAAKLFGQALALRKTPDQSKALQAESQADLAGLLADEGQFQQAIVGMRDALALLRRGGGDRNALGVEIWRDLGGLYRAVGDRAESEASYRQALEIALTRFGPGHPASISVQRPLAVILAEAGKLAEAEQLLKAAHERLLVRFGPEHAEVAASWQQLGRVAWEQGRLGQAQDALQRSLLLRRRSNELGLRGSLLCDLGAVSLALGQPQQSEVQARECRQLALVNDPVLAARADALLAEVALSNGDADVARALLASAHQQLNSTGVPADAPAYAQVALLRARLAVDFGDAPSATTVLQALLDHPAPDSTQSDAYRWRLLALQARLACTPSPSADGRALRARVAEAALAAKPEHQRLHDDIAALAARCGPP